MDSSDNVYSAIGISGDRISFLGNADDGSLPEAGQYIDLKGMTVLPGFTDSHLHMLNYGFLEKSYKMYDADSVSGIIEEGRRRIRDMKDRPPEKWLYGRGWNNDKFTDYRRFLTRNDLDMISQDRPVLFIRVCGHVAAVNSKALEMVMNLPEAGSYIHQIDEKNGILTEAAVKLCYNAMQEPEVDDIKEMILAVQPLYNQAGITAVESDNFLSLPGRNRHRIMQAYRELSEEGRLTVRVREQASFTDFEDMKEFIDSGIRTGDGDSYYSMGPVKLYQDGSLGARTALMKEPYEGSSENCGTMVHDREELQRMVNYAYEHDMQILVHAIGDRASLMVFDAYEKAIEIYGDRHLRLAINHLQITDPALPGRMAAKNILAYIQPVFVASDKNMVEGCVGTRRAERSYMWRTFEDAGVVCCGGSDSPVENFNILENIQIAVTRDSIGEKTDGWMPWQKLTVRQAVKLFTGNCAYGAFAENERGTLEKGKLADMTVLSRDIFETDCHEIADIAVEAAVTGGKIVYKREER